MKLYSETELVHGRPRPTAAKSKSTDVLCVKFKYYIRQNPSISAKEMQEQLVNDGYCSEDTVQSCSTISTILIRELHYRRKKLSSIARESQRKDVQDRFDTFMLLWCKKDGATSHFFY